jgi:hypothetical protein
MSGYLRSGDCNKCGTWRETLHKDHIVPRWRGGVDEPSNWQYLCANCHEDKTREEHRSEEFKAICRARSLGRKWTEEQKKRQGDRQRGKKRGPNASRGRPLSREHREALRSCWTPKAKEAARIRMLGKKFGPPSVETRAKISAAQKGKPRRPMPPRTDAHRAAISAAAKARETRKRIERGLLGMR